MKAICDNGQKVVRFILNWIGRIVVVYIIWLLPIERVLRWEYQIDELCGEQLEYI